MSLHAVARLARALAAAAVLATLLLGSQPVLAAPPPDEGFQPVPAVPAAPEATLSSPMLVKVAYTAIWLAVCIYLIGLWRRGQRLAAEMDELRRRLDQKIRLSEKVTS